VIRVALRGLAGRKLRAALTALAIVLGVAMISGSLVLTDTIGKGFDEIFGESYAGSDAVISSKDALSADGGGRGAHRFRPTFNARSTSCPMLS
jgi:putative ABC transport system permease protein